MLKETLLNALGEFYKIEPGARDFKAIEERYWTQQVSMQRLNLDSLLVLLKNPLTSDKELRFSLDEIIWPIENRRNQKESISEYLVLFAEIMKKEVYDADASAEQVIAKISR